MAYQRMEKIMGDLSGWLKESRQLPGEIVYTGNCIKGSNPFVSANFFDFVK